ncbi:glucose-1-phosphate cytidylyltransferase [Agrobacterium vaccinii]|uniref:glucose-1-phosphate cytidylyltransferase n=1 Tax=Agrobacterium vaccinii TaxID=2735528 RepID=UPI001E3136A3|nr:glucose-1-phosphate cytidylyltransferase [Agrobacterium vaccinii]UHS63926.1 glucose-1-phosphate cytidylyltransferase [Agrobacterium vaccinii]
MKIVILAGGYGTRISEESHLRPKPMIEIGGRPILWHIMKVYSHFGFNDFVICLGYRGYMIKEYFANYILHSADVTFDMQKGETTYHARKAEPWRVTLVETGEGSMTGGRLKRVADHLGNTFCLTYGDGVADIDIQALTDFHAKHGRDATVTSVVPPGRYGALLTNNGQVESFTEKPAGDNARINGGFFVLNRSVLDRIVDDYTSFEGAPLEGLARDGQLMAFNHDGFWRPMDTLRDKNQLEELWQSGKAPWKVWS